MASGAAVDRGVPGVLLRAARVADAEVIAEIGVRTGQHAYRGLLPDAFLDAVSIAERAERWRQRIGEPPPRSAVWVAEVEGEVVGFCRVTASEDADAGPEVGYLMAIYVRPAHAGRGIGTALLRRGVESLAAAGFTEATLRVLEGNARARAFYEANGWRTDGTVLIGEEAGVTFREVWYRRSLVDADTAAVGTTPD